MANLLKRALRPAVAPSASARSSWDDFLGMLQTFGFQGSTYGVTQTLTGTEEKIGNNFSAMVDAGLKRNGVIFACILTRMLVFAEARFQYRAFKKGRPGDLFGDASLRLLEKPWPGGTTGDLLSRMLMDADLAGNAYLTIRNGRIKRMRPDWVTIVCGTEYGATPGTPVSELDAELIGYTYQPGGYTSNAKPMFLSPEQVAHWAPIPDPIASYRGMSWMSPIIREVESDSAATTHKLKFYENGATANMIVTADPAVSVENFKRFKELFDTEHQGIANAYKTLFLGGGADAKIVGTDMKQMDFKMVQGAGETRIAAAAGVPPVIVGLSEGLQSATYSNYGQARRRMADGTIRPLWRNAAGSLANLVKVPDNAELWYDDRDIPFLREDQKDAAEIQATKAASIRQLGDAGFTPESVVKAVEAEDYGLLVHTGLFSVQLQPPNSGQPDDQQSQPGDKPTDKPADKPADQAKPADGQSGDGSTSPKPA